LLALPAVALATFVTLVHAMVLQVPGTSRGPVALLRAVPSIGAGLQRQG